MSYYAKILGVEMTYINSMTEHMHIQSESVLFID